MRHLDFEKLVRVGDQVKMVMRRHEVVGNTTIIDWVNYSFHESTIYSKCPNPDLFLSTLSQQLQEIIGYPLGEKLERGRNFFMSSWALGPKASFGFVGWGGQANKVGITINGTGCLYAKPGWERRLQTFLLAADESQISRVDAAYDDIYGDQFCIEGVIHAYHQGFFNSGGRTPEIELKGNHIRPNGRGRTVNIGSRENILLRAYEKFLQLCPGGTEKEFGELVRWIRIEAEIHHAERIIPFDILTQPSKYLAALYPFLSGLSKQQCRLETRKKIEDLSYARMKAWMRHQCGSNLSLMVAVEGPEATLKFLRKDFREKAVKLFPGVDLPQDKESLSESAPSEDVKG